MTCEETLEQLAIHLRCCLACIDHNLWGEDSLCATGQRMWRDAILPDRKDCTLVFDRCPVKGCSMTSGHGGCCLDIDAKPLVHTMAGQAQVGFGKVQGNVTVYSEMEEGLNVFKP